MRGIERWVERTPAGETWFAHVEADDGSVFSLSKTEYGAQSLSPDFWSLRKQRRSYSEVVAAGVKRLGSDFSVRIAPRGYKRAGANRWARTIENRKEIIALERTGASYGAPINAGVDFRIWLSVGATDSSPEEKVSLRCDNARRPDGRSYHHRFNAETSSTYDRCLDELNLFVIEFAEPWFRQHGPPIRG